MSNVTKLPTKPLPVAQWGDGLRGLFGHTYEPDPDDPDGLPRIQYQFEIIREVPGSRYVVQLFSWVDGSPTEVRVMSEAEVLDHPTVRLYATQSDWHWAYEKECDRRRFNREAQQCSQS